MQASQTRKVEEIENREKRKENRELEPRDKNQDKKEKQKNRQMKNNPAIEKMMCGIMQMCMMYAATRYCQKFRI